MERSVQVDGERDLLTVEAGGDRGGHAPRARTRVGGPELSLPSHMSASAAPRLALGAHSRSQGTRPRTFKSGFFLPRRDRNPAGPPPATEAKGERLWNEYRR